MTADELNKGMVIDCIHNSAASTDLLVIKSIHDDNIFCERFYSNEFLKGCNWQPFIIRIETWNNREDYLWTRFKCITEKEAMEKFLRDVEKHRIK